MAAALTISAGSNYCCLLLKRKSLPIEHGTSSIQSRAPLKFDARAPTLSDGKPSESMMNSKLFTPLRTEVCSRTWKLSASDSNVRAEASGNDGDESYTSFAPLIPETQTGEIVMSVLRNNPHLFSAAADLQLERLVADREAADVSGHESLPDLTLYKRIKEVQAEERKKAVVVAIYDLIVKKSVDIGVTLVSHIDTLSNKDTRHLDMSPAHERELEAVHSPDALEMVREHLAMVAFQMVRDHDLVAIPDGRGSSSFLDGHTFAQISKFRMGQVYAASILYGYFVRRVDQRFQLEKNMESSLWSGQVLNGKTSFHNLAAQGVAAITNLECSEAALEKKSNEPTGFAPGPKSSKLRSYVMSLDSEILQTFATIWAKESLSVIEKRAEVLFGKPGMRVAHNDSMQVSLCGLRILVLEAVAFGTFLREVETHVDSQYGLTSTTQ